jgi:hypothetical protein
MMFRTYLNKINEINKPLKPLKLGKLEHLKKPLMDIVKKYSIKEIEKQGKDIYLSDFNNKDKNKIKSELSNLFKGESINAIIEMPIMGDITIVIDTSKPKKMKTD